MYFFRLSFDALSPEELVAIVREQGATHARAGLQMVFPLPEEAGYYVIFAHPTDADYFRRCIQERGAVYAEPSDLPPSIKYSPQYAAFLMMAGYGY